MKQVLAPIISNTEVMPGVHLLWLEAPTIASKAKPGQFVMVRCGEDSLLPRPLSVHQVDGKRLALLFNVVGKGTQWLSRRKAEDAVDMFGPLGNGFSIQPKTKKLLLVAGGIGIAPLYFLASSASREGYSIKIILGAQTKAQLYPQRLMPSEIKSVSATENGTTGQKGMVTDLIPQHVDWADQVFACGPMSMYLDMAHKKRELKLQGKPVQVSLEIMMGCGRGVCYGCTIKTRQGLKKVCQDGPVFDLNDILWDE